MQSKLIARTAVLALVALIALILAPAVMADNYEEMKWVAAAERVAMMAEYRAQAPGNDACTNPFGDLAVGTVTAGSTVGAAIDTPPAPASCPGDPFPVSITSPGVWYTVTGTGNTMTATTCDNGGSANYDTKITVFCADCEDLICVAANDDDPRGIFACPGGFFTSTANWTSQAGATYRVLVHGFGGATGDFNLALLDDGVPTMADVECPAGDSDGDGVPDDVDFCADTVIPEAVPTVRLGTNRFALTDANGVFDTTAPRGNGPRLTFSIEDTAGCSCEQIIAELGLGEGHRKFGCSISAMQDWVEMVAPLVNP